MKNRYLVALMGVLVLAVLLSTEARAQPVVTTGQYTGNGTTTQLNSGLLSLKSLTIVHVASRGPSAVAYTTNTIQGLGFGTFLNGNKKDQGVAIEVGSFIVTNGDFNEAGVIYHWEARGD